MRFRTSTLVALALIAGMAFAVAATTPPATMPTLPDWEQLLVQNLTGSNGIPVSLGAPPAPTGTCAINTQLGGQATGSFKANGSCAAGTLVFTFLSPAPNGFECYGRDLTTPADTLTPSAYTTTTFSFATVTMAASDLVVFSCRAF